MSAVAAEYADLYDPERDFDRWYTRLTARRIAPALGPRDRVLEIGAATCLLTSLLCGEERRFLCVERSAAYVARAEARRLPGVEIFHGRVEDFATAERFDHVLAINVLHEIPDVAAVVAGLVPLLAPGGRLHVTLPNPRSLHRLVALEAGLIGDLCEMSARGRRFSTLRLYYAEEVVELMAAAGLVCAERSSILVKPLPNEAMERLPEAVVEAFDKVTATLPELGSMNYFVFRKDEAGGKRA